MHKKKSFIVEIINKLNGFLVSKRIPVIIVTGLVLTGVIVSAFVLNNNSAKDRNTGSQTNDNVVMPEVKVYQVVKKEISDNISAYGSVNYLKKVNVSSKLEEVADKINVDVGDSVYAGQVIATLKNEYIKLALDMSKEGMNTKNASYMLAKAKLDNAQMSVEKNVESLDRLRIDERQKKMELENQEHVIANKKELLLVDGITKEKYRELENNYAITKLQYESVQKQLQIAEIGYRDIDIAASGLVPAMDKSKKMDQLKKVNTKMESAEVDVSKSELEQTRLQLASADLNFKESIVRAPISGMVAMKYVESGEKVTKDKPIFTILDIEMVYIELPVPETEIPRIRLNQRVNVTIDAYPNMNFSGIVETIYPMVDVKTRTATVRCKIQNRRLDNKRYLLLPGMFVRGNIITSVKTDGLTVPFDSMAEKDNNRLKLFILKKTADDPLKALVVEKWVPFRKINDNYIEIADGLSEGDLIAVSGLEFLETGMRVKINTQENQGAKK